MSVYVEAVTPIRDWLRGLALVGTRVYAGRLPADAFVSGDDAADLAGTCIVVTRIGGGIDLPFDRPLIQFDCWAPRAGAATVAGELAASLCGVLDAITYAPVELADLTILGADVLSNLPLVGTHPRHVVTADVVTQAR